MRKHERQAFDGGASAVTATLDTLLHRDADFVTTLRAVLTLQPHMSAGRFDEWFAELQGSQRLGGSLGTSVVERVSAGALAAFRIRRNTDPAFRALVGATPERVASASTGRYCLLTAAVTVSGTLSKANTQTIQENWCSSSSGLGLTEAPFLQAQTDTGQLLVQPSATQGLRLVIFQAAFYRRGAILESVAQRRHAVTGWVLSTFDIPSAIGLALEDHPGLGVTLYHSNPGRRSEVIDQVGRGAAGAPYTRSQMVQIGGAWTVKVSGTATTSGLPADIQGLLVALAGAIVSFLLFALILVLSRSREHALGMVHEKTDQLNHQALHDALTGLPNRVLVLDRAEQMLARARRQHLPVAALQVDIDGFKQVNDSFGHAAGDDLLKNVATRLTGVVREGDTAARLSGDEFVVLVEGSTLDAGAEIVAERLLNVLRQPYDVNGEIRRQLSLTVSIGVASGLRSNAEELLRDADVALYEAKAAGSNGYVLFESDMQTLAQDRLTFEMDLAEALKDKQLFLLYQPIFDLRSESTIGVEALIRWRHPKRGVVPPIELIPMAEQSGLIVPIGRWVLQEACRQAAKWHRQGHRIGMSVNVSGRQLDDDEVVEDVRGALERSGLEPQALTLEITETTLMRDAEATALRLRELKGLGVRIAIDDFGTGYSSLAYLQKFPVDALKIDRAFIAGIAASTEAIALIRTLVQLGKALGIETLAEGIEDRVQLETLQREHCDHGQGFVFSRPLEGSAVEAFLLTDDSLQEHRLRGVERPLLSVND